MKTSDNICPDYHHRNDGFWARFWRKRAQRKSASPKPEARADEESRIVTTDPKELRARRLEVAIDYLQAAGFTVLKRSSGIWILEPIEKDWYRARR
jgi:hypothetical protein